MGPTSTGPVWPSLAIGLTGFLVVFVASFAIARWTARLRMTQQRAPVLERIDRYRSAARANWASGGAALLAIILAIIGVVLVCVVILALGELTKQTAVVHADRPVYRFFFNHRQGWLTAPLSWATHIGEYPEMTAIALAGALVIGFEIARFRVLLTVLLTALLIPVLVSIGHAYNWVDAAAFAAFIVAAALMRRQSFLLAALLMATMPVEKHLQSTVSSMLHGGVPSAADAVGGVGPFPSGGCARIVIVCGLVGYLLARGYRSPRMSIGISVSCALIAYFEGYSRIYLGKHWAVDCLGGLFFGAALLVVFIAGLRTYLGPATPRQEPSTEARARIGALRPREDF